MVEEADYDIPQHLVTMLDASAGAYMDALDLGCGAGHALSDLEGRVVRATGVDTSGAKLAIAAEGGHDALAKDDVLEFCTKCQARFNLVFATNVLSHFSELDGLFAETHRVLVPGGHFAFSVERGDKRWALQGGGAIQPQPDLPDRVSAKRFDVIDSRIARIRKDGERAVIGLLQVWKRL